MLDKSLEKNSPQCMKECLPILHTTSHLSPFVFALPVLCLVCNSELSLLTTWDDFNHPLFPIYDWEIMKIHSS